jgi:hypothetical protein
MNKYNKGNKCRLPLSYRTGKWVVRRSVVFGIMHSLARMNKEKDKSIQLDVQRCA